MHEHDPTNNPESLYSIGTGILFNKLFDILIQYKEYDTVMINIATLLRNHMESKTTPTEVVSRFSSEFPLLLNELVDMLIARGIKSKVVFYLVDYYTVISPKLLRPVDTSASRKQLNDTMKEVFRNWNSLFGERTNIERQGIEVELMRIDKPQVHAVDRIVSKLANAARGSRILLLTHMPVEYHLTEQSPKLVVLESHTGKTIHASKFAYKVFGEKYGSEIGFSRTTHQMFGDKHLIHSDLSPKGKRDVIEHARIHHWRTKSSAGIATNAKVKLNYKTVL